MLTAGPVPTRVSRSSWLRRTVLQVQPNTLKRRSISCCSRKRMSKPILLVSSSVLFLGIIALVIGISHIEVMNGKPKEVPSQASGASIQPPTGQPPTAAWTFAVSGDSRDCGDLVVPTLAAKIAKDSPQFYWHLGDFRLMYGIDEDMQCGPTHEHDRIHYVLHAWRDFIKNQASAFDKTPVFLGI